MADNDTAETAVDPRPSKATPLEAGEPVAVDTIMGKPTKTAGPNSTFAERAAASKKAEKKAVSSGSAENKAVASKRTSTK